jgi:hypothetical protein
MSIFGAFGASGAITHGQFGPVGALPRKQIQVLDSRNDVGIIE